MKPGTRIGPYEITAPIGSGGMGEVYRATDTKLRREVAVKVLPADFARDRDRLSRFEREAQVLASLNHPNIAAIYGIEEAEDGPCLVLEYVAGETLADRLRRERLPVDEALEVARQIASALEAAHEKGIVHRDLKPANVKISPEGAAKVLDFGLAKALADDTPLADASLSPTMTAAATQAGMILGTAAYMSPEQARGRAVDRRADIWAFGVVLFEMLSGKRLFRGETISEILASVIKDQPDLEQLPANLPLGARRLLQRCLTRDPQQRLRDIGEARIALEGPLEEAGGAPVPASRSRRWPAVLLGGVLGAALTAAVWLALPRAEPERAVVRSHIEAPEGVSFRMLADFGGAPVLSPDGTQLAFVGVASDHQNRLWVRSLDVIRAQVVPNTEGAYAPFWSPDGRSLGFFAQGALKRVEIKGGSVLVLAAATQGKGGTWNADDIIVFAPNFSAPLFAVAAVGGEVRQVTTLGPDQTTHRWPQFLPDGEHFLYFAGSHDELKSQRRGVHLGSLAGGEGRFLLASDASALYAAGRILSVREGSVIASPFDPSEGYLLGSPRTLEDQAQVDGSTWRLNMGASEDGTLVYQPAGSDDRELLAWVDRAGEILGTVEAQGSHVSLRLSPSGRYVATETQISPNSDIWIHDLEKGTSFKLTLGDSDEGRACWSPDERRIAFQSNEGDGVYRLVERPADGSRPAKVIPGGEGQAAPDGPALDVWPADWSPDGRFLLVVEGMYGDYGTGRRLSVLDLTGRPERIPLVGSQSAVHGRFSPDGRWITFSVESNGAENVFVAPFRPELVTTADGSRPILEDEPRWQLSFEGGSRPTWRADGREIYYISGTNTLVAVELDLEGDSLRIGATRNLFSASIRLTDYSYDVTADGRRFLLSMQGLGTRAPLVLVSGLIED